MSLAAPTMSELAPKTSDAECSWFCHQELKDAGFDLSIMGFGSMEVYHANDEYARLPDLANGFKVLRALVRILAAGDKVGGGDAAPDAKKAKLES